MALPSYTSSRVALLLLAFSSALFNISPVTARTKYYDFTVSRFNAAPDGYTRSLIGVNGQFPGPPIIANKGDRIVVKVTNHLQDQGTTLHAHGMLFRGMPWYDGAAGISHCPIPSGESLTYNIDTTDQAGTTWYHAHMHAQYIDGFVGPLIIKDPNDPFQRMYDEEYVVMLSDWYHTTSDILTQQFLNPASQGREPIPDSGLINGMNRFDCSKAQDGAPCDPNASRAKFVFKRGKRYRLRIINSSALANFHFSIQGHVMTVIEADMINMQPKRVSGLNINIGQRYSVIVEANREVDNFWMMAHMSSACMDSPPDTFDPMVLGIVQYDGAPDADPTSAPEQHLDNADHDCVDLDMNLLVPLEVQHVFAPTRVIPLTVELKADPAHNNVNRGFINGNTFDLDTSKSLLMESALKRVQTFAPSDNVLTLNRRDIVRLIITNTDGGEHPFHLHGHFFQVLAWEKDATYDSSKKLSKWNPLRRDTSTIPANGYTIIQFHANNPGMWPFHCHIEWHMQSGLLMNFNELPQEQRNLQIPESVKRLCQPVQNDQYNRVYTQ